MKPGRKVRAVVVTWPLVRELLTAGAHEAYSIVDGIPEDAELLGVQHEPEHDRFRLFVWSSTFDEVPHGASVPPLEIRATAS